MAIILGEKTIMLKAQEAAVITEYEDPAEKETEGKAPAKPKATKIKTSKKELAMMAKAASEFAKKLLAPDREENDKFPFGPFFTPVLNKAFEVEFFHILLPESCGGMGLGISALSVTLDQICQEDSSLGGIVFTTAAAQELMIQAGALRELERISAADSLESLLIGMPVFNNPSEIPTKVQAQKTGDRFMLSGHLEYVTLGGLAGHALVPASIAGSSRFSYFLVNLHDAGIQKSDPVLSLGFRACPSVDMTFNQVRGVLIGEEGKGADYFDAMASRLHVAAAAMALGVMKGSFKEALDYAKKRRQGGQEIIQWTAVKMMLATMAAQIAGAELMVERACKAVDSRDPRWESKSLAAAILIQGMAIGLTTDGIQALGGVGYMKDFGQEKRFRDAQHIQNLLGMVPMKKLAMIEPMI